MHGPKEPLLRSLAAADGAQPHSERLSLSTTNDPYVSRHAGRFPSSSVPHGTLLTLANHHSSSISSSSIALSSDTASASLDVLSSAGRATQAAGNASSTTAAATTATTTATATAMQDLEPPFWMNHSATPSTEDRRYSTAAAVTPHAATATTTTTRPAALAGSTSSSMPPVAWRCSIDFSHEIEARAEAELQLLWTTLWRATHSEAALAAALHGPRTHWNPYRPARGGAEVRDEVLNSEVAEFRAMVATDSLYVQGSAVTLATPAAQGDVSATSPHRPPRKHKKKGQMPARGSVVADEEVLVMDDSAVRRQPSPQRGNTTPAAAEPGAAAAAVVEGQYTEAWWAAHRSEAEAALFRYLWAAVVVPFYTQPSADPPHAAFASLQLPAPSAAGTAAAADGSLTLSPAREGNDDRDASGVVTAFAPTRDDRRTTWADNSGQRSPSLSGAVTPPRATVRGAAHSPASRLLQRSGHGASLLQRRSPDIVSDDSLEVEVLDDGDGSGGDSAASTPQHQPAQHTGTQEQQQQPQTPEGVRAREQAASPVQLASGWRTTQRRERPSTAGVQAAVFSPMENPPLGSPQPTSRHGPRTAGKPRARSARADDAMAAAPPSPAARPSSSAFGRQWTAGRTPAVPSAVAEASAAERQRDGPLSKPPSATRQRPPTAQLPGSRGMRVASPPRALAEASPAHGRESGGAAGADRGSSRSGAGRPSRQQRQLHSGGNGSGAAGRALQLLELRSRSTSRSPAALRVPSPFGHPATVDAAPLARPRPGALLATPVERHDLSEAQRHNQLSPMRAAAPQHRRRRRAPKQTPLTVKAEETPAGLGAGLLGPVASEKLIGKATLAPLRMPAAQSEPGSASLPALETAREGVAGGRTTSSSKARRSERDRSRTLSKSRPTTAHK